jgi:hypothetical protein
VADKLVEIRLRRGPHRWVLVRCEIQAQRDSKLGRRMPLRRYAIFSMRTSSQWQAWRYWAPRIPTGATAFHNRLLGTTMGIVRQRQLLDYARQTEELAASDNPFALITAGPPAYAAGARHDPTTGPARGN